MTTSTPANLYSRKTRNAVCATAEGLPTLGEWLNRIEALGDERLTDAIDGIWCGREGEARLELPFGRTLLCVGWYNGKVEFCYLS